MSSTVLIIGATSDMAKAVAHQYAKLGCDLVLAARNKAETEIIGKDIAIRYGVNCKAFELNILEYDQHKSFVNGLNPLPEISICFVGYLGDNEKALEDWNEASRTIGTNYSGPVSVLNEIALKYKEKKQGTIVGVSSVAGDRGRQSNYFYGSAKAGFTAYLAGLRNQLFHHNIHVLTVKPGFVATKMTEELDLPKPLTASPEQVAKAIVKGVRKKKNVIYVKGMWWFIMKIIKNVPESIFKKLKM